MRSGWGSASTLTVEDAQAIAREVPNVVAVSPEVRDSPQVLANGLNWNTQVLGESPDYLSTSAIGTWPTAPCSPSRTCASAGKVAVIGKTVADQLFAGEDPVGQTIRIRNMPFNITRRARTQGLQLLRTGSG